MSYVKKIVMALVFFSSAICYAQFLPSNTSLSVATVQRWMSSNRDFAPVMQTLDGMYKTDADVKNFDALTAIEQDQKITVFLQHKKMLESSTAIAVQHGWKSVGEYMRLSTRLGNAIAAYFFTQEIAHMPGVQIKALREKTDPAILAVPANDIAFVKTNENLLKNYIQSYAKAR